MTDVHANCSPGSHPHADRPNWQPAETIEAYLRNCEEGLETYSERRMAKLLGVTRVTLWRWRQMAEIPEGLFELLLAECRDFKRPASIRELASIGAALAGKDPAFEVERCPHCGEVLRVRGPWSDSTAKVVNGWLKAKEAAQ